MLSVFIALASADESTLLDVWEELIYDININYWPSGGAKKLKKESFFMVLLTNLVCPLPPEPVQKNIGHKIKFQ